MIQKTITLVAEIGSTTTVVNAFAGIKSGTPEFLGQGQAPTSISSGDVNIGLNEAMSSLKNNLGLKELNYEELLATSSAAGGLRMSVHGLVYDMTVRAAKEAALGAGAIMKFATAGKLKRTEVAKVKELNPNIILIAGGVDYGERETSLYNFEILSKQCPSIPIIYAGNVQNHEEIKLIAEENGTKFYIVENVYPGIDQLNVEPTRKVIHDAFEEHIIHASGMQKIRELVNGPIIPTPGAVMVASKLLAESLGDLIVFDVGGATTDLHSVTEGSAEINDILINPEPRAKRTVEGDLGVYVNMGNIVEKIGIEQLKEEIPSVEALISEIGAIPKTPEQVELVERLTLEAVLTALDRHAGKLKHIYGPTGKKTYAEGKDLTAVNYVIGTGGALTRLPNRVEMLKKTMVDVKNVALYPRKEAEVLIDNDYIMASIGVLSVKYKESALKLMNHSLKI